METMDERLVKPKTATETAYKNSFTGFTRLPTAIQAEIISYATLSDYMVIRRLSKDMHGGVTQLPGAAPAHITQSRRHVDGQYDCHLCSVMPILNARIAPFKRATSARFDLSKFKLRYYATHKTTCKLEDLTLTHLSFLSQFNRLASLSLQHAPLGPSHLVTVARLTSLRSLFVDVAIESGDETKLGPVLSALPLLNHLDIYAEKFWDATHMERPSEAAIFASLGSCVSLTSLRVRSCCVLDYSAFAKIASLERLSLEVVDQPTGPKMALALATLPRLASLTLDGVTYHLEMCPFPALTELNISALEEQSTGVFDRPAIRDQKIVHVFEVLKLSRVATLKRVIYGGHNRWTVPAAIHALPPGCNWYASNGRDRMMTDDQKTDILAMSRVKLAGYAACAASDPKEYPPPVTLLDDD